VGPVLDTTQKVERRLILGDDAYGTVSSL